MYTLQNRLINHYDHVFNLQNPSLYCVRAGPISKCGNNAQYWMCMASGDQCHETCAHTSTHTHYTPEDMKIPETLTGLDP